MRLRKGTETILVVDDNPAIVKLVGAILLPLGYHVLDAESGAKALQLAEVELGKVDLLLTDVVMPEMTGSELAGFFEEKWPNVKVLFMSGYMSPAISEEDRHSRQKGFLQKPLCPQELASKVRALLD
jgi:CheY-like chemotaxis protein